MYCKNCGNKNDSSSKYCSKCGVATNNQIHISKQDELTHHKKELSGYYAPSTLKMIILNTLSLGTYQVYWMAKQWGLVHRFTENKSTDTWGKAIFGIFYCYSLFKQIKQIVTRENIKAEYSPGWLATGFIFFLILMRADNGAGLIGLLSILCIIPVNNAMKKYLKKSYGEREWSFLSKGEFFSVIVGIVLLSMWVGIALTEENNTQTSTSPSINNANLSGYQYPQEARTSFNNECLQNSDNNTTGCTCLLNYFENKYSYNNFTKISTEYAKTKITPRVFEEAIEACK